MQIFLRVTFRWHGGKETRTSTASVSNPTRLKSSINAQIAMFNALYRGEADDSAFSR